MAQIIKDENDFEKIIEKFKNDILDADKILIGFGKEFELKILPEDIGETSEDAIDKFNKKLLDYYMYSKMQDDNENASDEIPKLYKKLFDLIKDKDYFAITLATDDRISKVFNEEKCVSPCGNIHLLQCDENCSNELIEITNQADKFTDSYNKKINPIGYETIDKCSKCGSNLVFNTVNANAYNEDGYLEKFGAYQKWLQTTINKKLVILELGVGMNYPTVIRMPFDKICYYNQKCNFYRVHKSLYQHISENSERGISIKMTGKEFLSKL